MASTAHPARVSSDRRTNTARLPGTPFGFSLTSMMLLLVGCLGSSAAVAHTWSIDTNASNLGFASIKNGVVVEGHVFRGLTGSVDWRGNASLSIPLATVDTAIGIRDQRMRDLLFDIAQFPIATFSAEVDMDGLAELAAGASVSRKLSGALALHGKTVPVLADVRVTALGAGGFLVASTRPVVVSAPAFGLVPGLDRLQSLAGLQSITPTVPVNFSLVFRRD